MMIICKNCGGKYDSSLSKCPYCSTMNKKGAYRDFRHKVQDIIDGLTGLRYETSRSMSRIVFSAILRGLIITVICVGIGAALGLSANVNYYNDKEYDQDTLEDIIWEDENLEKMEKAYAEGDYETVRKLIYQNTKVTFNWEHYASFMLKDTYDDLFDGDLTRYRFEKILYFICYPDYYANTKRMSDEEYQDYLNDRSQAISRMNELGYSESELLSIYDSCKDNYGYIEMSKLDKYMKEANNG